MKKSLIILVLFFNTILFCQAVDTLNQTYDTLKTKKSTNTIKLKADNFSLSKKIRLLELKKCCGLLAVQF